MPDREKVIKDLEEYRDRDCIREGITYFDNDPRYRRMIINNALALLKELETRIQKYEYVFDFLGIGFRQWATKILDGEAEVICETDEHEHKTVVTFKLI